MLCSNLVLSTFIFVSSYNLLNLFLAFLVSFSGSSASAGFSSDGFEAKTVLGAAYLAAAFLAAFFDNLIGS